MQNDAVEAEENGDEYYSIPEEAVQYLPEEWRNQIEAIAADGRAVLKSVDGDLTRISKLASSYITIVSLKHIQKRLGELGFAADMELLLELDVLTLAFVVTYARLHEGGVGSGFSRDNLPANLRGVHDQIIELRNKRFAHNAGHHTVSDALEIISDTGGERFEVKLGYSFQVQVGGDPRWKDLIDVLDEIFAARMNRFLARISEKTGRKWSMIAGEPPE